MKKILLSIVLLTAAGLLPRLIATTLTVNNSNPSPGQYNTMAAAITAAAAGDTLLVVGTPTSYGNFTINKNNLTIIGSGHNPQKTPSYATTFGDIATSANLNGCKIRGVTFGLFSWGAFSNVDNVTIEYCRVTNKISIGANCNNYLIKNCVFVLANGCAISDYGSEFNATPSAGRSDIQIVNNIFSQANAICYLHNGAFNVSISNNVFLKGTGSNNNAFTSIDNALITNNIFYQISPTGVTANGTFNNNLSYLGTNNALPPTACTTCTGSGNFVGQDPLFTTYTSGQNFTAGTQNFILQAGSPGKNAGTDGTDLGVYGLNNIFSETGEPPIPFVRTLTIANPNTAQGAALNVTITGSNPDPDQ